MTGSGSGDIYTQNLQNGTFQGWKKYWNDSNLPAGSGVTSVATGTDLSGGTITTTGTLNNTSTLSTVTGRGASTGTSTTFGSTGLTTKLRAVNTTYYTNPTYTWTKSAIQTTSIEIIDATTNNANVCATLVMHNYGDGGVKFRMGNTGDKTLYLSSGQASGAGNPTDDNSGTYFDEMKINNNVVYHAGNLPSGSGVTSVATGSGLTGGTITSTGTLSVDSTVIRTSGTQSITGNTTFYPSSTSTGYSTAAIELMASSSGTSGTPPRIAWHWGGVVASSITIEANGTIAVRNNPGNAYEKFKASIITATSNFSGNLTGNVTGNVTGSSGSCTGNSATATLATTATNANNVVITGYGNSTFTFYQSPGSFAGFSGWHNYFIGNHGNGSNYYNTTIAFPFWGPPRYSRREGNVLRGPYNFLTNETNYTTNYYIQSNASLRAPIFYDTNTNYYGAFASTSVLNALQFNYTQHGSANNIRMGNSSTMNAISSGTNNVALGVEALGGCSSGSRNFATGYAALFSLSSGGSNIAMGDATGYNVTSGSNNLLFGQNAGRTGYQSPYQSIAGVTSGSNQIHMGNESHTTARIQISWTVNSDSRDKTDVEPIDIGLDFVKQLNPVTYRWDKRSSYEDRTPTGENKLEELTLGFLAQEVEEVEKSYGYDVANKTNLVVDRDIEQDHYGITYEKMIPILTKAIQELEARVKELENK